MRTDPKSLDKAMMNEQFRILIVEPPVHKGIHGGTTVMTSNATLYPWSVTLSDYPTALLIWTIASRPESHLKVVFPEPDLVPYFWEEKVPVDSDEACEDAEKFLHK